MPEPNKPSIKNMVVAPSKLSWIDRLIDWIERLPGPPWLLYLTAVLATAFLANAIFWIDGGLQAGDFDPLLTGFSVFVFYWLAMYHYLTRIGSRSLHRFRPLLDVDDAELTRLDLELGSLPGWIGWLSLPLGVGFAIASILDDPAPFGSLTPKTLLPTIFDVTIMSFLSATFFCVIIRSIRQLRMVDSLHQRVTNINLLKLEPAHAFSGLTARTGSGVILLLVLSYPLEPIQAYSTFDLITWALLAGLAIAVFILPVIGLRRKLEAEKEQALHEASDLLQITLSDLHENVVRRDFGDLEGKEKAVQALMRERELLAKISTWPWDTPTLRGFASTLLLPIFLFLVTRLLERIL